MPGKCHFQECWCRDCMAMIGTLFTCSQLTSQSSALMPGPSKPFILHCRYGSGWDTSAAPEFMANFISKLGNTEWMKMNNGYTDSSGNPATADITYRGGIIDASYSAGNMLSDEQVLVSTHGLYTQGQSAWGG